MEAKVYTAAQLAEIVGASAVKGNPEAEVSGVDSLRLATENNVSFLGSVKYLSQLQNSKAGVILIPEDMADQEPAEGKTLIVCAHPDKAFGKLCGLFAPATLTYEMTIHPTAYVHPTAKIAPNVHIGANAVVDERAEIGEGAIIRACAYIGQDCKIGEKTVIHPNVSIMHACVIGKRCIIHAGTTIGADGFGYTPSFKGLLEVPQNGIVQIDDDVEIGANSAVDRARFSKTWVKKGVKIDNLVQVGHNVIVGESSALIGQCGIAGSAVIGRGCSIGGQAGINGHIELADGTQVIGPSAVQKNTKPGESLLGFPAEGEREFLERHMIPRKVRRLTDKVKELEELVKKLQEQLNSKEG